MKFGDLEIFILNDGYFRLDGGAMFGVVPRPLWEKKCPPDARNRIRLAMNCVLVRTAGQWVLIETGAGDKLEPKLRDIYDLHGEPRLLEQLAAHGVQPADVDLVIDTHLHFDHCGWNTRIENGRAVPTFPNARYVVQRGELEHARQPNERDRASYFNDNYLPVQEAGQFWLVDGECELAPGISVVCVPGHNRDMQCVRLTSGGRTAFCFVDLVPTTAHVPFPWIMGYDLYPLTTLENKRKWIPQAAREGWLCIFTHDANVPAAYLREREGKYEVEPVKVE
jgi:glyoxylase-like metal-dependent hydrolase (beta-lactamase superfamily II)